MVQSKQKGNSFEWKVARHFTHWLRGGDGRKETKGNHTGLELVRSVQSGGW